MLIPDAWSVWQLRGDHHLHPRRRFGLHRTKVAVSDAGKADRILPAMGGDGSLAFLYHVPSDGAGSAGGWQSVDVTADGKTLQSHHLGDIADAALVQPVVSNGSVYTGQSDQARCGASTLLLDVHNTSKDLSSIRSLPMPAARRGDERLL